MLCWPESQLEPPSAAQRRVRCSLPPQGRLSCPESQPGLASAAQRRGRCSLPPQGVLGRPGGQLEPPRVAQHRMCCSLPSLGVRCWPDSQLEPRKLAQHQAYCNPLPSAGSCTAFVRARCTLTLSLRRCAASDRGPRLPTTSRACRPCLCVHGHCALPLVCAASPPLAAGRAHWPPSAPPLCGRVLAVIEHVLCASVVHV